jgi:hypothetical protein
MNKHLKKLCVVSVISVAAVIPTSLYAQVSAPIACADYKRGPTNIPGQKVGKKVADDVGDQAGEFLGDYIGDLFSEGFNKAKEFMVQYTNEDKELLKA